LATDWKRIVTEYGPVVWRTAYRLVGNPEDAADCTQETFMAALGMSRRREVRCWPGLLHRIVTSRAIDCLRGRLRTMQTTLEGWDDLPDIAPGPQERSQFADLVELAEGAGAFLENRPFQPRSC